MIEMVLSQKETDILKEKGETEIKMLHFLHIPKGDIHIFSSSYPQFPRGFPQILYMWKTVFTGRSPQQVFHIHGFFRAESRVFMRKTMWKMWKAAKAAEAYPFQYTDVFRPLWARRCGKQKSLCSECFSGMRGRRRPCFSSMQISYPVCFESKNNTKQKCEKGEDCMKSFIHRIVTRKMETLRLMLLMVLCGVAACLWMEDSALPAEAAAGPLNGLTVALDPGHGGYDGGARAHDSGVWEKELTLQIALQVEAALTERGAQVILTRREDVCLAEGDTATRARKRADLQKRMDIAEAGGADVFLSIHLNEYRSRAESGPQVFYQQGGAAGKQLALHLQKALIDGLNPKKERSAMAGDYYVLRGKLPSALVECGFLSHAQEEKLLLDAGYQRRIGEAIAAGLENYLADL